MNIDDLLRAAVGRGASDLHLKVGAYPMMRLRGALVPLNEEKRLSNGDTEAMGAMVMSPAHVEKFKEHQEIDLAYSVAGLGRFRCNIFQQRGTMGLVLRVIPSRILSVDDLLLPPVLRKIADEERGLVLVTGTTGSGKSTTLAAMIDHINSSRCSHVMTVEDPIEFLHRDARSIVNQREVAVDTHSFSGALRSALAHGLPHELLDAATIRRRFAAFRPSPDMVGVWEPRAGFLFPEQCIAAHLDLAVRHGAVVRSNELASGWAMRDGAVEIETTRGTIRAQRLVLASGAWITRHLGGLELPLEVERVVQAWFEPAANPEQLAPGRCPIAIWEYEQGRFFYAFPLLGGTVKAALHHQGSVTDPDLVQREVGERQGEFGADFHSPPPTPLLPALTLNAGEHEVSEG